MHAEYDTHMEAYGDGPASLMRAGLAHREDKDAGDTARALLAVLDAVPAETWVPADRASLDARLRAALGPSPSTSPRFARRVRRGSRPCRVPGAPGRRRGALTGGAGDVPRRLARARRGRRGCCGRQGAPALLRPPRRALGAGPAVQDRRRERQRLERDARGVCAAHGALDREEVSRRRQLASSVNFDPDPLEKSRARALQLSGVSRPGSASISAWRSSCASSARVTQGCGSGRLTR